MHGVARDRRLPEHQLIDKGTTTKPPPKPNSTVVIPVVKPASAITISFKSIPDLKMSEQLIPVAYCFHLRSAQLPL